MIFGHHLLEGQLLELFLFLLEIPNYFDSHVHLIAFNSKFIGNVISEEF